MGLESKVVEHTEKVCEIRCCVVASRKQRILKKITFYLAALIRRNCLEICKHRNSFFKHPEAPGERCERPVWSQRTYLSISDKIEAVL